MTVTLICPNLRCRSILQVPESVRGKRVRCGKCGKVFIVPTPTAAPKVVDDETSQTAAASANPKS